MSRSLVVACLLATGCHTVSRLDQSSTTGTPISQPTLGSEQARPMTMILTEDARFRFVEPLTCGSTQVIEMETSTKVTTSPNLATFIVGVVASGLGTVALASGLGSDDGASSPFTYLGGAMLVGGLPFAIGPWIGNGSEDRPGSNRRVERAGDRVPCGERGVAGASAEFTANGFTVFGTVDAEGYFQVSPYSVVDAFDPKTANGWDVHGTLEVAGERRPFATLFQPSQFGRTSAAFLARARFDATIGAMRLVPGLVASPVRVSLTSIGTEGAIRVVSDIFNEGPGESFAVRAMTITNVKELDGRIGYVGRIAKGETKKLELFIPISPAMQAKLRGGNLTLAIQLFDGHGTAPVTPIRFQGAILNDIPR